MIGGVHLDGIAYRPSINGSQSSPPSLAKAHESRANYMTSTGTKQPGIHTLDVWQPLTTTLPTPWRFVKKSCEVDQIDRAGEEQ